MCDLKSRNVSVLFPFFPYFEVYSVLKVISRFIRFKELLVCVWLKHGFIVFKIQSH